MTTAAVCGMVELVTVVAKEFKPPVVVVMVVDVVVVEEGLDLASAAFCASRAALRLGLAPIITLNSW